LLVAFLAVALPVASFAFLNLQARLERWDQERHAQD
jgi:hypothetical protein